MAEETRAGWTPGPYEYGPTGTPEWARQYAVYHPETGRTLALVYDGEQAEGNARLFAAAPELAGALERLADRVEQIELADGSTPDTLEARALLARIEEQP